MGASTFSQYKMPMQEEWEQYLASIPKPTLRERLWLRRYDRDLLKVRALIEKHEFQVSQLYKPPNGPWIDYVRRTHAANPIICNCCGHYSSGVLRGICFDCRDRGCKDAGATCGMKGFLPTHVCALEPGHTGTCRSAERVYFTPTEPDLLNKHRAESDRDERSKV